MRPLRGLQETRVATREESVESEKVGLKLNIQKTKIMASDPITSWEIDGETMETVADFIFLGFKITADGDYTPGPSAPATCLSATEPVSCGPLCTPSVCPCPVGPQRRTRGSLRSSSCLGRKPPRAPQLEETPETPPVAGLLLGRTERAARAAELQLCAQAR